MPIMNKTRSVVVHRVLVTLDDDGRYEMNYSFICPHCGKEHTQREADYHDPLMDSVYYSTPCGGLSIYMPWFKGRNAITKMTAWSRAAAEAVRPTRQPMIRAAKTWPYEPIFEDSDEKMRM